MLSDRACESVTEAFSICPQPVVPSVLILFSALNLTCFIPFCFSSISSCILETLVTIGGLPLKSSSSTVAMAESQLNQGSAITSVPESKLKKICCACPETKILIPS
ncbi:hypothetical protein Q3G72_031208 [Acer saccharum]|nr:hypothetical protein Q3G72_031208 [Acer saccharum]